jgi:formylglycine-generating enzyme required for sulfatase activity
MMKDFMTMHWLNIPGGQALLAEGGYLSQPTIFDVAPFAMARYPVTNAQYAEFIAAGGYINPTWWRGDAWTIKEKGKWAEPRYWPSRDWNRPDYPVVGVSWYEAIQPSNSGSALPKATMDGYTPGAIKTPTKPCATGTGTLTKQHR